MLILLSLNIYQYTSKKNYKEFIENSVVREVDKSFTHFFINIRVYNKVLSSDFNGEEKHEYIDRRIESAFDNYLMFDSLVSYVNESVIYDGRIDKSILKKNCEIIEDNLQKYKKNGYKLSPSLEEDIQGHLQTLKEAKKIVNENGNSTEININNVGDKLRELSMYLRGAKF